MGYLEIAYRQMEKGSTVETVDASLALHLENVALRIFNTNNSDNYYSLYPLTRVGTQAEWEEANESDLAWEGLTTEEQNEFQIPIEYDYCVSSESVQSGCTITLSQYIEGFTFEYLTLDVDMVQFKASDSKYADFKEVKKEEALKTIIVTISSGKEFYADSESRQDISDAISLSAEIGQTVAMWKLPTGIEEVTVDELKEARMLGLSAKGSIVGI